MGITFNVSLGKSAVLALNDAAAPHTWPYLDFCVHTSSAEKYLDGKWNGFADRMSAARAAFLPRSADAGLKSAGTKGSVQGRLDDGLE